MISNQRVTKNQVDNNFVSSNSQNSDNDEKSQPTLLNYILIKTDDFKWYTFNHIHIIFFTQLMFLVPNDANDENTVHTTVE